MEFTRVNSDINGNPRYVVHFLDCQPSHYNLLGLDLSERYAKTVNLMNTLGGRKFHNKQFGGGIVFQSYNNDDLERYIEEAKAEADENAFNNFERYIIDRLDYEYLDCGETLPVAFAAFNDCFKAEYGYEIERRKGREPMTHIFGDYLAGLPSAFNIDYYTGDILKLAEQWGAFGDDATERQKDKAVEDWFNFMAWQIIKFARKFDVEIGG